MPVIEQSGLDRVKTVKGLPKRWGAKAYREIKDAMGVPSRYKALADMLDSVTQKTGAASMPLDATDAQIIVFAHQAAAQCDAVKDKPVQVRRTLAKFGIPEPDYGKNEPKHLIARACDRSWVLRQVRKIHGQRFEHAAIRLGFVSVRSGAYASDETVRQRIEQNARNRKILESVTMENGQGQSFTLAELAAKSTSNKAIRRGELMLRMRGLEEIANELGHVGVFVTLTCPSKYHAILSKSGTTNPHYNNATPKEAHAYLNGVWQCIRAKNGREGVQPYGFRIAEPHHDGCPHWHMLVFVAPEQVERCIAIMREYALAEDGTEPGARKNRIKIVRIEAGKGTAAGYIAKYIGKNIDDEHVEDHIDEDGSIIAKDLLDDDIIKPCQRVEAWAGRWCIRQFQPMGSPPITVWREMRRVQEETIRNAPQYIRDAWQAAQKIEGQKNADFAAYIRAQGGVNVGRQYRIAVATRLTEIEGRYGMDEADKPCGIYGRVQPNAVYESVRFQWTRSGGGVAFDLPWTRVNNCTPSDSAAWMKAAPEPVEMEDFDDSAWFESPEFENFVLYPNEVGEWEKLHREEADLVRANTVFTQPSYQARLDREARHGRR